MDQPSTERSEDREGGEGADMAFRYARGVSGIVDGGENASNASVTAHLANSGLTLMVPR